MGCGIIGATLAYELSRTQQFKVTVLDEHGQQFVPAGPIFAQKFSSSTGGALGVLMGVISRKLKGRAWEMRRTSIRRYETLIPELEAATGMRIGHNRHGLLRICFENEPMEKWEKLVAQRHRQGFRLQVLGRDTLMRTYPQLRITNRHRLRRAGNRISITKDEGEIQSPSRKIIGAVYSPQDLQVNPVSMAMALIEGAVQQGATFYWGWRVTELKSKKRGDRHHVHRIETTRGAIDCDGVIITAGLGSSELAANLNYDLPQRPVLGQAVHLKLPKSLSITEPVIIGQDVNIIPLEKGHYWVGATVEFGDGNDYPECCKENLEHMLQTVFDLCPRLRDADILRTWSGLRPRPQNRPAPVIESLANYDNAILATAHYRNGVLLAPATAELVYEMVRDLAIAS
ncbi:MAG: FAD-dependent oxidoreductase [Cyanobacteria bacterium P01_D01_bin.73]